MDITILKFINGLANQNAILDKIMVFFAEYFIFLLALFMVILWFVKPNRTRNREMLLCAAYSFIFSEIIGKFVGVFVYHTQPFTAHSGINVLVEHGINNSFPSDHTILVFSILTVFFLYNRNIKGFIALLLAFIVGFARIFVGVHYPIDVGVGIVIGVTMSIFCYTVLANSTFFEKTFNFFDKITSFSASNKSEKK